MAIRITGGLRIRRLTNELRTIRWKVPSKRAQLYMIKSLDLNFKEGGRPTPWRPSRRAIRDRGKTLSDTGLLRASIVPQARVSRSRAGFSPASVYRRHEAKADGFVIATSVPYGKFHQFGTRRMVRRSFLMFQVPDDLIEIKKIYMDYIREVFYG